MSSAFFKWKSLSIEQNDDVLKVGTDSILLGSWVPRIIRNPLTILDAGTGNGVITLMLTDSFPAAYIIAIDTDENAVKLADKNFRDNHKHSHAISRLENVLEFSNEERKYDLIVSNPPYFFGQLESPRLSNRNAKHGISTQEEWMCGCKQRLDVKGDLCVIVPYENAFQWIRSANKSGLYCQQRVNVKSFEHEAPVRSLLHFNHSLVSPAIQSLTIYESINTYTAEYLELTGIEPAQKL